MKGKKKKLLKAGFLGKVVMSRPVSLKRNLLLDTTSNDKLDITSSDNRLIGTTNDNRLMKMNSETNNSRLIGTSNETSNSRMIGTSNDISFNKEFEEWMDANNKELGGSR